MDVGKYGTAFYTLLVYFIKFPVLCGQLISFHCEMEPTVYGLYPRIFETVTIH